MVLSTMACGLDKDFYAGSRTNPLTEGCLCGGDDEF